MDFTLLIVIQLAHTIIAIWNYFSLFYIIYSHLWMRRSKLLRWCYITILIETIAVVPLSFTCPIRILVDYLYSEQTADILIPRPYSDWIMPMGIVLFAIAWISWLYNFLNHPKAS